nr:NADH dehydrogenase subunit 5 [Wallacea dactyliferae]
MICMIFFFGFLFVSLVLMLVSMILMSMNCSFVFELLLISVNSSNIIMVFFVDWVSILFFSFVLLISSSVVLYSRDYMGGDLYINRFIVLIVLFVLSMGLMIFSPNLVSIILGWDGLGLISYCLVVYYQSEKSYNAGMVTILMNRLGDVALLMSIVWMMNFGSWNYYFYLELMKDSYIMITVMIMVILAGMTKSAQIPFSSWLPAAMAAPTPVSSLVHSSTLVTAGVYLLLRFSDGFTLNISLFMFMISLLTMFMSGLGANFEFDLKKIIALSTLSQLGLMMSIMFLGDKDLAFFHLLTHALFKALLFMCAGFMIHSFSNCQDIRCMGGLINIMPVTFSYFSLCNLSLCGFPFLSGFYSKDLIVEVLHLNYIGVFSYTVFMLSIGLTVMYTVRLLMYSVFSSFNYYPLNSITESLNYMVKGMSILIFLVFISGSSLLWMFLNPYYVCLPYLLKFMTLFIIVLSFFFSFMVFNMNYLDKSFSLKVFNLTSFMGSMWNLPYIFTLGLSGNVLILGKAYYMFMDQGWEEYYGKSKLIYNLSLLVKYFQLLSLTNLKMYYVLLLTWLMFIFLN